MRTLIAALSLPLLMQAQFKYPEAPARPVAENPVSYTHLTLPTN